MNLRILDLDGGVVEQAALVRRFAPTIHDLRGWGPRIRLGCRFGQFARFAQAVNNCLDDEDSPGPAMTLVGSGDFHHVSLALLQRLRQPFNLVVIDNHPDWMRGLPFMHCGTWVHHAARLPNLRWIFHVGGDVDFDNGYRWLAPWRLLRQGKINVFPSVRQYSRGNWRRVPHQALRAAPADPMSPLRLESLLQPFAEELRHWPLYVSLDKDAMSARDATVNWDSGHLNLEEVKQILEVFTRLADYRMAGMDIVGDWSEVNCQGLFRKFLHWSEHPRLQVVPAQAHEHNDQVNQELLLTMLWGQGYQAPALQPRRDAVGVAQG